MMMKMINRRLASRSLIRLFSDSCAPRTSADSVNRGSSLLVNRGGESYLEILPTATFHGDENASQHKKQLSFPMEGPLFVSGPCNGRFCVYSDWKQVSLLDPSTGDIKHYDLRRWNKMKFEKIHSLGFGFDSKINDFKIVRSFTCKFGLWDHPNVIFPRASEEMVDYAETISLDSMQRKEIPVVPKIESFRPSLSGVSNVDGVCYWSCKDSYGIKVVSFNLADEVFDKITYLPSHDDVTNEACLMSTFNGLPAAILYQEACYQDQTFEISVKRETWVKEMSIGPIHGIIKPLCFFNNQGLILLDSEYQLVLYDFVTKQLKKLDIKVPITRENPIIQVFNLPESSVPIGDGYQEQFHFDKTNQSLIGSMGAMQLEDHSMLRIVRVEQMKQFEILKMMMNAQQKIIDKQFWILVGVLCLVIQRW